MAGSTDPLYVYFLSSFHVERGRRPLQFRTRKIASLFAYLALHREAHTREKLASLFWSDDPDRQARGSLRNALTELRRVLGLGVLQCDRQTIRIDPRASIWIDAFEFQSWASDLLAHGLTQAGAAQLELYRGELLPGLADSWISPEREYYRSLFVDALLRLAQEMRSRSEYGRAVEYARRVLGADRSSERAHQHLMFCYLAMGDQASAIRQYEDCQAALSEELSVQPAPETTALYRWIARLDDAPGSPPGVTNLPVPVSSFIGRAPETGAIKKMLDRARLVTLTGPGGSGKTRLAIQAAADLIDRWRDGVWWSDLSSLRDPALVPQAVAQALGLREPPDRSPADVLCETLRQKRTLLVVDNCEHLVHACASLIEQLLAECPGVRVLATSREPLGLAVEEIVPVHPLSFPADDESTARPMAFESVRLFAERARAAKRDFELTSQNARAVLRICRRLEGFPLAVELAAARVRHLAAEEIQARLDDRLQLLNTGGAAAPPRLRTLRASLDWSYDLLSREEAALFRRLAVFDGGLDGSAATAVAGAGADIVERLVAKSLLVAEERAGQARYHLLETVRSYAQEKMIESGEAETTGRRHAEYYAALAEEGYERVRGSDQAFWLDRLDAEQSNLRAAIQWAHVNNVPSIEVQVAGALWLYWFLRGSWTEGRMVLHQALNDAGWLSEGPAPTVAASAAVARALHGAGQFTFRGGDSRTGQRLLEKSAALWRGLGDRRGLSRAMNALGELAHDLADYAAARSAYEESCAQARAHGVAIAESNLALLIWERGDGEDAAAHIAESLRIWNARNDRRGIALGYYTYGLIEHSLHATVSARRYLEQSAAIQRELGIQSGLADTLQALAGVALRQGDAETSLRCATEAAAIYRRLGNKLGAAWCDWYLGSHALGQSKTDEAETFLLDCLRSFQDSQSRVGTAKTLTGLASVAAARRQWERAARLLGAADALLDQSDLPAFGDGELLEERAGMVCGALGDEAFAALWMEGREHRIGFDDYFAMSR